MNYGVWNQGAFLHLKKQDFLFFFLKDMCHEIDMKTEPTIVQIMRYIYRKTKKKKIFSQMNSNNTVIVYVKVFFSSHFLSRQEKRNYLLVPPWYIKSFKKYRYIRNAWILKKLNVTSVRLTHIFKRKIYL